MSRAIDRYLQRHSEPALFKAPGRARWDNVAVVPYYRDPPESLASFQAPFTNAGRLLVIAVLNRPDTEADTDCNAPLREAIQQLPRLDSSDAPLFRLADSTDLLLLDLDESGPLDAGEGVGLARKTGCDLALAWHVQGHIASPWINSTDADARLPTDYFSRLPSQRHAAICWPYCHGDSDTQEQTLACQRYELRLHHYVLGLAWAGSPYAFHTLGSCISVHAEHYAQVGGFPRRNGAEDFYLLNKLAKTGPVLSASGDCLYLQARPSDRVPFGTGPAIRDILRDSNPDARAMYDHPHVFVALRAVQQSVTGLRSAGIEQLDTLLEEHGCDSALAAAAAAALINAGLPRALEHCRQHSSTGDDFRRHFEQWFDGFRTLKFLHALRDSGYPDLALGELAENVPIFWPDLAGDPRQPKQWLRAARRHLGWHCRDPEYS